MPCFNGAAALTLRKPQLGVNQLTGGVTLQWGRSVNAAETGTVHRNDTLVFRFNGAAALTLRKRREIVRVDHVRRVLQWGRSVNAAETSKGAFSRISMRGSFNGAAALTLRKHA